MSCTGGRTLTISAARTTDPFTTTAHRTASGLLPFTTNSAFMDSSTREEDRAYGVVTDYLWRNEQKSMWQDLRDAADFNDMKTKTANYLQDNKQIASCLTVLGTIGTHGGSSASRLNNGVIAYGWNNKPFGFNGRAYNWAEGCKGSNIH